MLRLISSFINKSSISSIRNMSIAMNPKNIVWMDMEMTGKFN